MPEDTCEQVRMSAMAAADGQTPALPADRVAEHLRHCDECRRQVEGMQDMLALLGRQRRAAPAGNVRAQVMASLARQSAAKQARDPLRMAVPVLAIILLACRAIAFAANVEISLAIQVVPVVLAAATFAWLKANPFAIDTDLQPKGANL
jgi:predicted anti-sigma-YlaC factor YlaD